MRVKKEHFWREVGFSTGKMNNYNAIARGKGSSQARDEGCQMCREEKAEAKPDWDGWERYKNERN